ncbi:MAG: HEPN domain-containing protein [Candidatus Margulisbacteria bacterium]|nr:HEPN domain-containing protein [Candidatus Margulisiibacteriota bacterium]MBU1616959.1 HEPN domain-containing protein [Candidatus Margulisiibacteriota bacterium]
MVHKTLVQEWVEKAEEDLGFASKTLADPDITYYAQICFHFQQAAEKYLKAYIVAFNLEFKKTHDLPELLRLCVEKEPELEALANECELLTDYYIETRYPVHWPSNVSKEEAKEAQRGAIKIKEAMLKFLSPILS